MKISITCPKCKGLGFEEDVAVLSPEGVKTIECKPCKGTGKITAEVKLSEQCHILDEDGFYEDSDGYQRDEYDMICCPFCGDNVNEDVMRCPVCKENV